MARAKATSIELDDAIWHLVRVRGERSPKRVHQHLIHEGLISTREDGSLTVSEKTIARRIRELTVEDSSGPWSSADADPDEAGLAIDVVTDAFFSTDGRIWLTQNHVAEIARLRKVAPGIPSFWAQNLAEAYLLCKQHGRDSRHLDFALGVRPWEGWLNADKLARALGLQRTFRVTDDMSGPLFMLDSAVLMVELSMYEGSVEEMRRTLESLSRTDPIPDPPEVIVVDGLGRPTGLSPDRTSDGTEIFDSESNDAASKVRPRRRLAGYVTQSTRTL